MMNMTIDRKKPLTGAFDLPSSDIGRTMEFYTALFGWKFIPQQMKGKNFFEIHLSEGKVIGALINKENPQHTTVIYMQVEDVNLYKEKVVQLGGSLVNTSMHLPNGGIALLLQDMDGNQIVVWEERNNQTKWPTSLKK